LIVKKPKVTAHPFAKFFQSYGIPPTPLHEALQEAARQAGWTAPWDREEQKTERDREGQKTQKKVAGKKSGSMRAFRAKIIGAGTDSRDPALNYNRCGSSRAASVGQSFPGSGAKADRGANTTSARLNVATDR
jgi:hypothetical protein